MKNTIDFIAIDFETATVNLNSACSLGIVSVSNLEIIDKKYYLIQPPDNRYSQRNIEIHHITPNDTKDAPTFDIIWPEIKALFKDYIVVAHNIRFDLSVLHSLIELYGLECDDFPYIDSIAVSNRAIKESGYTQSLVDRAAYFNIPINNHHNALDDAITCANITIASVKTTNRKSLRTYCSSFRKKTLHHYSDLKPMTNGTSIGHRYPNVKISDISSTVPVTDASHPLCNKNIVLTGDLETMSRKLAMQRVVNVGGVIKSAVSKNTDFLVVGKQDSSVVGVSGKSTKELKAEELIAKGISIQVLNEQAFIELLDHK